MLQFILRTTNQSLDGRFSQVPSQSLQCGAHDPRASIQVELIASQAPVAYAEDMQNALLEIAGPLDELPPVQRRKVAVNAEVTSAS